MSSTASDHKVNGFQLYIFVPKRHIPAFEVHRLQKTTKLFHEAMEKNGGFDFVFTGRMLQWKWDYIKEFHPKIYKVLNHLRPV